MNQHTIRTLTFFPFVLSVVSLGGQATAQVTSRVSTSPILHPGNADSGRAVISSNGAFVAFESLADNLVASDTNGVGDVFVRELASGDVDLVSVSTGGAPADDESGVQGVAVSADGRFVAFASRARNLGGAHSRSDNDIFVRDRLLGRTLWASPNRQGLEAAGNSEWPSLSADGRFVVFHSDADDLVNGDTGFTDVFVRDLVANVTERISVDAQGGPANAHALVGAGAISADGRFVAFTSVASNLVAGDVNGLGDVFVRDRQSGVTTRISRGLNGVEPNGMSFQPALSANGRFVIFRSDASNLVAGDTNAMGDVFLHDRQNGATRRVSVATGGVQANFLSGLDSVAVSDDGRFACFASFATNLVAFDDNLVPDIFVHDTQSLVTERVSVHLAGAPADRACEGASMSSDGRVIAFWSSANRLVEAPTGGSRHVYVHDRAPYDVVSYCTAGPSSNFCSAVITGLGLPTLAGPDQLTIVVSEVDAGHPGLIFYGVDNTVYTPTRLGTGFLCVKPPLQRTPLQMTSGEPMSCAGEFSLNWSAYMASHPLALGHPLHAGQRFYAQGWHRDAGSPVGGALSNALAFVVQP